MELPTYYTWAIEHQANTTLSLLHIRSVCGFPQIVTYRISLRE